MINIPFMLWAFGIIIAFAFSAFGFIAKPRIHAMIIATALFLAIFTLVTDNLIMGYSMKSTIATNETQSFIYEQPVRSGTNTMNTNALHIRGAIFETGSSAIGQPFQCIDVQIRKAGTPAGNYTVGVWNSASGATVVRQFGTDIANNLITADVFHTFCLDDNEFYVLELNDIVGVMYNNTNASPLSNNVQTNEYGTSTDPNVRRSTWSGVSWSHTTTAEFTVRMYNGINQQTIIYNTEPDLYPFTEMPKMLFLAISSMLLIASITLMVKEE